MPSEIQASATRSNTDARLSRASGALLLIGGAIVAVGINWIITSIAIAGGADPEFAPLAIYVFGPFTVVGYAVAHLGWRIVRSRAARPGAVLRVTVPVLTVLSFVPDSVLLATGFIPDSSLVAVAALALMHLVAVAVVVFVSRRVAPVR